VDKEQKQTILDLPKVIAVGISSPIATILTSRFGVAGTLIGLALGAVILTVLVDVLKVYLARAPATMARVPDTVVKMPGGLRARLSWRNILSRLRAAFARFSSLPSASARRRSILIGSVVAAGISFFVGLSVVTALEVGVGKSLSCWVWDDCPAESSTDNGEASRTGTLPSILGGGPSASSDAPEVQLPSPRQGPDPGTQEAPLRPGAVPGPEQPPPDSPQPGQRWSPSGVPEDLRPSEDQGPGEDEDQQPGEDEDQQPDEDQQQSPAGSSESQQPEDWGQEYFTPPFST
jgi:hypothetical protein